MSWSSRPLRAVLVVVLLLAVVGLVRFLGPSVSLDETVLHEETSQDSGVTYEYAGSQWSSDLLLVRVNRLTGPEYELRIGPHAEHEYYPVTVGSGGQPPRIRSVRWRPDGVVVGFGSGVTVQVPAANFRSVR